MKIEKDLLLPMEVSFMKIFMVDLSNYKNTLHFEIVSFMAPLIDDEQRCDPCDYDYVAELYDPRFRSFVERTRYGCIFV